MKFGHLDLKMVHALKCLYFAYVIFTAHDTHLRECDGVTNACSRIFYLI